MQNFGLSIESCIVHFLEPIEIAECNETFDQARWFHDYGRADWSHIGQVTRQKSNGFRVHMML